MGPSLNIRAGGEPKYDPVYRARVSKAKSILCYYDETTFHVSPMVLQENAPSPRKCGSRRFASGFRKMWYKPLQT